MSIDARHAIAHNKIMVIDGEVVLTGSFNFTSQAEHSNAENLLAIGDSAMAAKYAANWSAHAAHSEPYQGREGPAAEPAKGRNHAAKSPISELQRLLDATVRRPAPRSVTGASSPR